MKSGGKFQKITSRHRMANVKFQEGMLEQTGGFLSVKEWLNQMNGWKVPGF